MFTQDLSKLARHRKSELREKALREREPERAHWWIQRLKDHRVGLFWASLNTRKFLLPLFSLLGWDKALREDKYRYMCQATGMVIM